MAEQVNLFAVAARSNHPLKDRVVDALAKAHAVFDAAWPTLEFVQRRCDDTAGGWDGDVMVTDDELAFHHLFLEQLEALLDAVGKKIREAHDASERRIWTTVTNRGSQGFVAYDKTFEAEGDLIPTPPSKKTPEYGALLDWLRENGWEGLIDVSVPWQSLKKLCEERAAAGDPMPPHVKLSPKTGVKVRR